MVESDDVRYIDASSMLPTQFVEMQTIVDKYDLLEFVNVQCCYNLLHREDERDLNKYCKKHNIDLTPWSPNPQGLFTRPVGKLSDKSSKDVVMKLWNMNDLDPQEAEIINRVEELSKKKNVSIAAIFTAWVIYKGASPMIGMSNIARVDDALADLKVEFTEEEAKYLEEPYKPKVFLF